MSAGTYRGRPIEDVATAATLDRYVRRVADLAPWHRIASPERRGRHRLTLCGTELAGIVLVTPWIPPVGESECMDCRDLFANLARLEQLDLDQLQQDGAQ